MICFFINCEICYIYLDNLIIIKTMAMKFTYLIFIFAVLGSKIKDIEVGKLNEIEEPTDYYLT